MNITSDKAVNAGRSGFLMVLMAGLLTGIGTLVAATSFAALIFSGALAPFVTRGIGIALVTAVVCGVLVSLLGTCSRAIAIPQDRIAPVLALMAAAIVAGLPADLPPAQVFSTVTVAIVVATLLTGLSLTLMGLFRIGGLVRFAPQSVVGGFLAGTGWLLLLGGLRVGSDAPLDSPAELTLLLTPASLMHWLPGIGLGLVLLLVIGRVRHPLALPLLLIAATVGCYGLAALLGLSAVDLADRGWLLGPFPAGAALWRPLGAADLAATYWPAIREQAGGLLTIVLLSAVSILMTVSALELMVRRDLDVNRELRAAGFANLVAGLGGGMVGFHSLSFSALVINLGVRSRAVGLVAALVSAAALLIGPEPLGYLPRPVLSGLLAFLGLSFLTEWLLRSWSRVPRSEWVLIAVIALAMAVLGFLPGVGIGLLLAIGLFVINYSRTSVIRAALPGSRCRSTVERHPAEEGFLRAHGDRIHVVRLQGYLFFGTTRRLRAALAERLAAGGDPLRYLLLDFERVTGVDPSAVYVFAKLAQLAEQHRFRLVVTHVDTATARLLEGGALDEANLMALRLFPDLDHGLEWCEEQVLARHDGSNVEALPTILAQLCARLDSDADRAALMGYLAPLSLPPGSVLAAQGESSDALFFVEAGTVSVYRIGPDGARVRLRRTGPGTVVGEVGLYLGVPRSALVTTDGDTELLCLSAEALARMEREAPRLAAVFHRFMVEMAADRLLRATKALEDVAD
jgi:SulP family sulfate permease